MSEKDGGPAFPGCGQVFTTDAQGRTMPQSAWGIQGEEGMSLLDWFAGMALQGWLASAGEDEVLDAATAAKSCYGYARAMLAEREKQT